MGMFDTILFDQPFKCNKCGSEIESTQTKQFEKMLITYKVGDILPGDVITGVIKERLFCDHPDHEKGEIPFSCDQEIYLALWHHVLIGIFESYDEAERATIHFGIGEMRLLYDRVSEERDEAINKANRLEAFLQHYGEFVKKSEDEREAILNETDKSILSIHWYRYLEFLREEDPVQAFLESLEALRDRSLFF